MKTDDHSVRQRVIDEASSFIVQAPAGSGKTELLTQRFLKLLSSVGKPERVLAITFTRKATQEMRERIMHRLRQAENDETGESDHEKRAIELAAGVLEQSNNRGWNLLENPGRLQIQTIDGLCARVSSRAPRPGNGVTGLTVVEEAKPLYMEAARRLIEDAATDRSNEELFDALCRVLVYLKGSASLLQDMLSSMLGRRDLWLNNLAATHFDITEVLSDVQDRELVHLDKHLGRERLQALSESLAAMARLSTDKEKSGQLLATLAEVSEGQQDTDKLTRAAHSLLSLVATTTGSPFSPVSVKKKVLSGGGEQAEEQVEVIKEILTAWREDDAAVRAFTRFIKYPPLSPSDDSREVLKDFQLILKYATAELRILFVEDRKSDFSYVAEMALEALGDELSPGDALLLEDGALEHILLDEFQDTSQTQFELIRKLVSGWQMGDGRSLFLVGDPMQSIYRFRKADVSLFNRIFEQQQLGDVALDSLQLTANFRSSPEVIDFVNENFPSVFSMPDVQSVNFVPYTPVESQRADCGLVKAHPYPEDIGWEGEAELVAKLVADRRLSDPDATIAILGRARVQLEIIAQSLRRHHIPFEAVQVEGLSDRPVILDLLSILRAIIHPADRVAWLSLLRAPWCALSPREIEEVVGHSSDQDILERIGRPGSGARLSDDKKARLSDLNVIMRMGINARSHIQLSRLVEVTWIRLKGPFAVGSVSELDNANQFFKLLSKIESEQHIDLVTAIEEGLERFYSGSRSSNLKLMTIHKAKGLEFDLVILPGLHRGKRNPDTPLMRLQEIRFGDLNDDGLSRALLAPRKRRDVKNPGLYDYLGKLESEQEALEDSRVLYVAVTRAKRELHLFGGWKWNKKEGRVKCSNNTFLSSLWRYFERYIDIEEAPDINKPDTSLVPLELPQLCLYKEPEIQSGSIKEQDGFSMPELRIPDRDSVAVGQAYHLWMELIHDNREIEFNDDWFTEHRMSVESSLLSSGASEKNINALTERLANMITETLESKKGQFVASSEGKTASWAEPAFISRDGAIMQVHILDRLYMNDDGDFTIVDYKTGFGGPESKNSWQSQLDRYSTIIEKCTGKKVAESFIYQPESR